MRITEEKDLRDIETASTRRLVGKPARLVTLIAVGMSLFHLYTAGTIVFQPMVQRPIHLGLALILVFLLYPWGKRSPRNRVPLTELILALGSIVVNVYLIINWTMASDRVTMIGAMPGLLDLLFGAFTIFLVIEATRRVIGWALPMVSIVFLIYGIVGHLLPGILGFPRVPISRIIAVNYIATDGIFGIPLGVSATFVFLFVLFGAFLQKIGGGQFFIDLAYSLFGRFRGGPAKIAVVASACFGTISGSGIANVAGTGQFTIPLMKKTGYQPAFAGAVEAAASIGGQLMPPVMGAAAFIMAEILGIPYISICIAAVLPAILYFLAIFVMVDLEAAKTGLRGLPKEELPEPKRILKKAWYLFIPLVILIYLLVIQISPMKACFWSIMAMVVIEIAQQWIRKKRIDFRPILEGLEAGAKGMLIVVTACACAGIVIGIINMTGFGLKFSDFIIDVARGSLLFLLIITMLSSLILGMGLPTVACYIILAIISAPAIVELGVMPLAAHLFVFYFGIIAAITPPVALAAYVGAGIAGANPMRTGFIACRLGLAAFLLPYMFIYGPAILMKGNPQDIVLAAISGVVGIWALAAGLQGYFRQPLVMWQRVILLIAAVLLIKPGLTTDLIGYGLVGLVFLIQRAPVWMGWTFSKIQSQNPKFK
ncbi:MAG: TRAP transporter permease [Deltaproteobacteria bacterium]|nr:TRAP transporter permease [Deltaproteobacteria bacterium]